MKFFIKVTLCGILTCIMSAITIGIGYGAVFFIIESLCSHGIEALFLFLFSLLLIVVTILALFMIAVVTHILRETAEDSIDIITKNIKENDK